MIIESAIDFFRTGQLDNIPFGTEKGNLIKLLGETDEKIENTESSLLKYDKTEFYFYHHKSGMQYLEGILIQPIPISAEKGNLRMDYFWLTKKLKYDDAKKKLKSEHINFIEIIDSDSKILKTERNLEFLFFSDNNYICKVGRFVDCDELERLINGG